MYHKFFEIQVKY